MSGPSITVQSRTMPDTEKHPATVSHLEMMGALASRLIHDLANHLSVISGNAQFADMLANDPQKVKKAAAAILKSTNVVSNMIGQCGEFRRNLGGSECPPTVAESIAAIQTMIEQTDGWNITLEGTAMSAERSVPLESRWSTFIVQQFIRLAGTPKGQASVSSVRFSDIPARPGRKLRCAPPECALEIALHYVTENPVSFEAIKMKFTDLETLGAFEMVHVTSGWVDTESSSESDHAIYVYLPITAGTE